MRCTPRTINTSFPIDAPWRQVAVLPRPPKSDSIELDDRRIASPSAMPYAWEDDDDDEDDEDFADDEEDVDVGDDEDDDFFDDDDEDMDDEEDADEE
jgi:hypothetical protein